MKNPILWMMALAGLVLAQNAAAVPAGTVLLATGDVAITDAGGKQRPAKVGMAVESGETIATQNGRTQIKFADGGLISLQPSTEFKVSNYQYGGADKQSDSSVFELVKGGLRAVTGAIGKVNKNAYRMDTEMATIGIRGTEFQATVCSGSCPEPDGLYVRTGEGTIFVKNPAGELDVGVGQSAYVASVNNAPQSTSSTPAVSAQESSGSEEVPGVGNNSEFRSGDILATKDIDGTLTVLDSAGLALAGSGSVTGYGELFSGAGAGAGAGVNSLVGEGAKVGVYLNNNEVTSALVSYNNDIVTVKPAAVVNTGHYDSLYWGRWTNTTFAVHVGLNTVLHDETISLDANSSLHYMLGTSVPTVPGTGTATYSFVGGTASTDQTGTMGSGITSGTLTANFFSNSVGANLTVNHGGTYNVSATMPLSTNRASFSSMNAGGSASTTGAGMYGARVSGFFAGSATAHGPSSAGVSYEIQKPTNAIVGVGAFSNSTGTVP